jgi:transcription antitermination factor NusG
MSEVGGNLQQVRSALHGITGVESKGPAPIKPESYFVIARVGRERETVDSLRRNGVRSEWPSYEVLEAKRERGTKRLVRRMRRVGVLPGYVFASPALDIDFEDLLRLDKVDHDFKCGEKVSFIDDTVRIWPAGTVEKLAHDGRIGVEVELMGRKMIIWVLPHQIERRKHRPARDAGSQPKALDSGKT